MSSEAARLINPEHAQWPPFVPVPEDRELHGSPHTSTVRIHESPTAQMGLWRVTPGAFSTDHTAYLEHMQILAGLVE